MREDDRCCDIKWISMLKCGEGRVRQDIHHDDPGARPLFFSIMICRIRKTQHTKGFVIQAHNVTQHVTSAFVTHL